MQAVIWDYDGTLMDTYPTMTSCLQDALAVRGFQAEREWLLTAMKDTLSAALRACGERFGTDPDLLLRDFRALERVRFAQPLPLPGVPEAMEELHEMGIRQMLCTHRDVTAVAGLKAHRLDRFLDDAVTSELGFPRKPDPASLQYLLDRAGIPPEEAVMVGDRPLDIEAGQAAGTHTCLLDPEERFPQVRCDLRLVRASDLPAWVRKNGKEKDR